MTVTRVKEIRTKTKRGEKRASYTVLSAILIASNWRSLSLLAEKWNYTDINYVKATTAWGGATKQWVANMSGAVPLGKDGVRGEHGYNSLGAGCRQSISKNRKEVSRKVGNGWNRQSCYSLSVIDS